MFNGNTRAAVVIAMALAGAATAAAHEKGKMYEPGEAVGAYLQGNGSEALVAQIAAARTQNPDVRDFALRVAEDDFNANRDMLDSIEGMGIRPEDSSYRHKVGSDYHHLTDRLWSRDTEKLDQKFIENFVEVQSDAIEALDEDILPSLQDPKLRDMFTTAREQVATHLQAACGLQQQITGKACESSVLAPLTGRPGQQPGGPSARPGQPPQEQPAGRSARPGQPPQEQPAGPSARPGQPPQEQPAGPSARPGRNQQEWPAGQGAERPEGQQPSGEQEE